MTTMARSTPPMRRLFDSLDYVAKPRERQLRTARDYWTTLRGSAVVPAWNPASKRTDVPPGVFVCHCKDHQRDYLVTIPSLELSTLLGGECNTLLSAVGRREAARLRRLFDSVIRSGEPVIAEYTYIGKNFALNDVTVFVAPIEPAGVLGAIDIQHSVLTTRHTNDAHDPLLFALGGADALAIRVAHHLRIGQAPLEERDFEDGEHKIRSLVSVRGRDVFVLANLTSTPRESVNDKLCKLLFFVASLKQSAASTVTVVAPYLCYARKERQTKPHDPVTTRYLAQILEAVGTDRVIVVSVHNLAAFQNSFRCQTEHLDTDALFTHALAPHLRGEKVAVVSPDLGGEKRAELFREALECALRTPVAKAIMDKHRSMGIVTGELFAGDVKGCTAIIFDDLISTGGTMLRAAVACRREGASKVIAVATHGLFSDGAKNFLHSTDIDAVWITDSIDVAPEVHDQLGQGRLHIVGLDGLLAGAIRRCHAGGSINALLEHDAAPQQS